MLLEPPGTGVYLYGIATGMYSITLDTYSPTTPSPAGSLLYHVLNLNAGAHTVTLTSMSSTDNLTFTGAVISIPLGIAYVLRCMSNYFYPQSMNPQCAHTSARSVQQFKYDSYIRRQLDQFNHV
jgi:hypothetical protein